MTLGGAAKFVIRSAAAISILRGVHGAAVILGLYGAAPFETLPLAEQARIIAAALSDIAAGTALWLLAPWGVVLWNLVALLQGGFDAWNGDLVGAALQTTLLVAVFAAVRASRRAAEKDAFRFS